jgi:DNA-binding LacI/PurR family transcriptional regulator
MITKRTQRVRIADVAEAAGVSKTAVSFAFNSPDRLSEETAARIRGIADQLGYRPDPVARMLTKGQTRAIGLLTPQPLAVVFSNPFFGALCEGVGMAADLEGYGLYLISPLHGSLARAVSRASVDGLVAIGLTAGHPEIEEVRRTGLPLVLVDSLAMPEHSSVTIDDEAGAHAAADHLIALGHREFLVIAVEPPAPLVSASPDSITARRLAGYRSALSAAGIGLPDEQVETEPATVAGGAAAFARAWSRGLRPTAVLAMSDAMAIGVIRAADERGLRVPEDLSVIGFDDVDVAAFVNPPLTTIHQPVRRKGEEAVRLLLAAIERRANGREQLRLDTHIVVRASTGPVPARNREVTGAETV